MGKKIDKSDWKTKNPRLFEYDSKNEIVDIFIREDPKCPFPFHEEDWWHQGFYIVGFIMFVNDFFERYKLPYTVMENEEIEDLRMLSQPRPISVEDKVRILNDFYEDEE